MPTTNQLLGVMIGVAIAMLLFSPINTAVTDNTGTVSVANETVTADAGNYTQLDGYQIESGSETVWGYNETAGSFEQATSPDDYELDLDRGRILVNSSSSLIGDGEDVKVSYDYTATDGTTTNILVLVPLLVALLALMTVAAAVTGYV